MPDLTTLSDEEFAQHVAQIDIAAGSHVHLERQVLLAEAMRRLALRGPRHDVKLSAFLHDDAVMERLGWPYTQQLLELRERYPLSKEGS